MCLQFNIDPKWPPFIEFFIWFIFALFNVSNHFGVWSVVQTDVIDITPTKTCNGTYAVRRQTQIPQFNSTSNITAKYNASINNFAVNIEDSTSINLQNSSNLITQFVCVQNMEDYIKHPNEMYFEKVLATREDQWIGLIQFRFIYIAVCSFGLFLVLLHVGALMPNIIQSCRTSNPELLKESDNAYYRSVFKIHCVFLFLETVLFDVPIGCCTMEMLKMIWQNDDTLLSNADKFNASKTILALSMIGLAFFSLYKGMMPLFLWIGNPFCFPCIPLRLLVVFPGGLISLVMTMAPIMAVATNGLLKVAPPEYMQAEIGGLASTFVSIGTIFWVLGIIMGSLIFGFWYKFCRPGATGSCGSIC